jgi:hypothetical protein
MTQHFCYLSLPRSLSLFLSPSQLLAHVFSVPYRGSILDGVTVVKEGIHKFTGWGIVRESEAAHASENAALKGFGGKILVKQILIRYFSETNLDAATPVSPGILGRLVPAGGLFTKGVF